MSKLDLLITPTSITVYDSNKNRVVVYCKKSTVFGKKSEIVPEVSAETKDVNTQGVKLATLIAKYLMNKKSKDSYQRVFSRLAKLLTNIDSHSFETLYNRLDKVIPKPEPVAAKPAETVKAEVLEAEVV